ncbi:hypothetical protein RB195_013686 [Necator americanus]|uniref:Uncharacterized protein n=1 Tax=Necator americanus TaxID=51031 RepID=A0ABR1DWP4_NECAM
MRIFSGKIDEKDLQKLLGLDLQHARGIKLWEDEDKSNTEKFHWHPNRYGDHPKFKQHTSNPWRDNFRIKNDDIHFHYENFRNIPEKEKLLKEGLPTDVRDLVDYMAFLMYQQAKETISSHFPMFPNPFRKQALPRIPFPHIDLTR